MYKKNCKTDNGGKENKAKKKKIVFKYLGHYTLNVLWHYHLIMNDEPSAAETNEYTLKWFL